MVKTFVNQVLLEFIPGAEYHHCIQNNGFGAECPADPEFKFGFFTFFAAFVKVNARPEIRSQAAFHRILLNKPFQFIRRQVWIFVFYGVLHQQVSAPALNFSLRITGCYREQREYQ